MVETIDDNRCILHTGSHSIDSLAVYVGLIGIDFDVREPAELVDHIRTLADRLGVTAN